MEVEPTLVPGGEGSALPPSGARMSLLETLITLNANGPLSATGPSTQLS